MNEQLQIVEIGDGPLRARLVNRGASVAALTHDEIETPLVLGYDDPAAYLTDAEFMGAIVGRVANRIDGTALFRTKAPPSCMADRTAPGRSSGRWRRQARPRRASR